MTKSIYNICPYSYYRNDQIMKDPCLIPYTFYKIFDYTPVIVTAQREEYTYLELLPGLKTDILKSPSDEEEWLQQCMEYIRQNYEKISILFCFGSYFIYTHLVPLYKSLNKTGKVILKLDANSHWMDRIPFESEPYKSLYEHCDIITCESKSLKQFLSRKLPYQIDYIVNGSMPSNPSLPVSYEVKRNTILTVGRIGAPQKANHILLEAFAKCASLIPDWNLKLIGPVEPSFEPYLESFFQKWASLKDRIQFTGRIENKDILEQAYKDAKIFVMTSTLEGGTPNVFSEAARNGCYMVCSQIDAAEEFTDWERCGKIFPCYDTDKLSKIFLQICNPCYEAVLMQGCRDIQIYHRRFFQYDVMVKKLMHLLNLA